MSGIKIHREATDRVGQCNFCRVHVEEVLVVEREDPVGASIQVRICATCAKAIGAAVAGADPFAALRAAEEAVLVAGGWKRAAADEDGDDWWEHDTKGRESHDCALAVEQYEHEHRAIGGAAARRS